MTEGGGSSDGGSAQCGFLSCRPQWLRPLSRLGVFAAVFCLGSLFESMVSNGLMPTTYQSLETRYAFRSTVSGVISIQFDIAFCILALPVAYLGSRYLSKPVWLAGGFTVVSIAALTMSSPQFIADRYRVDTSHQFANCDPGRATDYCDAEKVDNENSLYPAIFCIGNFLLGGGTVTQNTLAVHYFHENSGKGAFYYGLAQASRSVGALLGAGLNTVFLGIPVDLDALPVGRSHSLWVGAWWIGFLISSLALAIIAPIVAAFPAHFPSAAEGATPEAHGPDAEKGDDSFVSQVKALVTNVPFVVFNLASVSEAIIYSGVVTFAAKYFQQSLAMSASQASLVFAAIVIVGTVGSVTGAIVSKHVVSFRSLIKVMVCISLLEMGAASSLLFHCPEHSIVGVDSAGSLTRDCNSGCRCSDRLFKPVCSGGQQDTFYSMCYAGCHSHANCSCIPHTGDEESDLIEEGYCALDCPLKYVVSMGVALFCFAMVVKVPIGLEISLKLIPDDQASMAMALTNIMLRLSGMIPGPLIFGVLFDDSCGLWQEDCQGESGACLKYDLDKLSLLMFLVVLFCATLPHIFYFISYQLRLRKETGRLVITPAKHRVPHKRDSDPGAEPGETGHPPVVFQANNSTEPYTYETVML